MFALAASFATATISAQNVKPTPQPPPPPANDYFPDKWVQFSSKEGKFKAAFPGQPKLTSVTTDTPEGKQTSQIHQYGSGRFLSYAVMYTDFPRKIENAAFNVLFDNLRDYWKNLLKDCQVTSETDITLDGHAGKFLQIQSDKAVMRVKGLTVENRLYVAMIVAPIQINAMKSEDGYKEIATAFLDSFHISNLPESEAKK